MKYFSILLLFDSHYLAPQIFWLFYLLFPQKIWYLHVDYPALLLIIIANNAIRVFTNIQVKYSCMNVISSSVSQTSASYHLEKCERNFLWIFNSYNFSDFPLFKYWVLVSYNISLCYDYDVNELMDSSEMFLLSLSLIFKLSHSVIIYKRNS